MWTSLSLLRPKFLGIFLLLGFVSGFWVVPRIIRIPEPQNEARFHHHLGDGFTELGVVNAHLYWKQNGYAATSFLPCITDSHLGRNDCPLYTHYPAGFYLFSSLLLDGFEKLFDASTALQATRYFLYFLSLSLSALALFLLSEALGLGMLATVVATATLGLSRGFWLFADNLFGNGFVLSLFGILVALMLGKKNRFGCFFLLSITTTFFSVELIPALFLLPGLRWIFAREIKKRELFCYWALAAGAVALIMGIRILQNAWYVGNLGSAVSDWVGVVRFRVAGGTYATAPAEQRIDVAFDEKFFRSFLPVWVDHQRLLVTKLGLLLLWGGLGFLAAFRQKREFLLLFATYLIALQWSFLFVQHSMIHLFTVRYVIWALALSAALLTEFMARHLGISRVESHTKNDQTEVAV
ncbi:MAG: hypothetical protein AB7K68_14895 [Bacteriovoracia bacterium]